MSVTIRVATPADLNAVVDLWDGAAGPTRLKSDIGAAKALLARDPQA